MGFAVKLAALMYDVFYSDRRYVQLTALSNGLSGLARDNDTMGVTSCS